jgi:hypothetical protein
MSAYPFATRYAPPLTKPLAISWAHFVIGRALDAQGEVFRTCELGVNDPHSENGYSSRYRLELGQEDLLALTDLGQDVRPQVNAVISPLLADADVLASRWLGTLRESISDPVTLVCHSVLAVNFDEAARRTLQPPVWMILSGYAGAGGLEQIYAYVLNPAGHLDIQTGQPRDLVARSRAQARYQTEPWTSAKTALGLAFDEPVGDFMKRARREILALQALIVG